MFCGKGQLVFEAPDPIAVRSVLPHAKILEYRGKPHIVVKHELDAVTILRNIGIEAPSPVNHGWTYPGRHKPFEHQKATVEFLTVNRRGFVLSGMGSGKTAAALWAAEYLMVSGVLKKVLIVCPKSCTHKVWEDEIFQTLMHRTAVVVEGGRERKRELAASDSDFIVVNHDGIHTISDIISKDPAIGLVIWDEASNLRNGTTQRYKAFKNMLKPSTRLWLLTATPCPNAPTDAWALARLVRPETVPPYFTSFKRQTMIQVTNFKWVPKPEATQMAYEALQPAIRFRTEDCIDLPPVTYQNRACELSAEQRRMMKDMAKQLAADKDGVTITAANAAVKMVKLLQLSAGLCYSDTGETVLVDSKDRLDTLKEILEEADHKVIVWVPFKHVMEHLREELSKDWGVAVINGDVSGSERARIITAFQDPDSDPKVLIAHPATAAHGLTLTTANICVWYGPTFSAELYEQSNARVARPGQKHHMTIIHIGSSALEWDAYGVANNKVDRQKKILNLYRRVLDNPL
jgi:SNF2 family DNA or RNA helicase